MLKELELSLKAASSPNPRVYQTLKSLKRLAKKTVLPFQRGYVRYFPLAAGKAFIYSHFIKPYLGMQSHQAVVRTRSGARMECRLPDLIQFRIYFFGVWEPQITSFISQRLRPGDCFIDVGANVGYYTLLAASIVGESGKVCAIEASPSIFKQLKSNVARNGCSNVELFSEAASDREGVLEIFLGPQDNISVTTTDPKEAARHGNTLEARIQARTLPQIVGLERLLRARLIKIDVEGAEDSVIRGIGSALSQFSDQTEWVFEVTPEAIKGHGKSGEELIEIFRKAGYKLYLISNDYSDHDYVSHPKNFVLTELKDLPEKQVDVVASKMSLI